MQLPRTVLVLVATAGLVVGLTACSRADSGTDTPAADQGAAAELRLGYFPNITHAAALIGVERNLFSQELGTATTLTTQTFNTGNEAVGALLGGSLDITFIGSGPTINGFAKSDGEGVRLISGATSGGAQLVVRPDITGPDQLRGKQVATPQLGNTQDISLKKWLSEKGIGVGEGPDQVTVVNADNPQTFEAFRAGQIDAAWLPEPWSSRLVVDAGAKVLVDEKDLWADGEFPTTVVIVRTKFLQEHPQTVQAFLRGLLASIDWAGANPDQARTVANTALERLTGKALADAVIERAFANITLTTDPLAGTFPQLARDGVTAGVSSTEPDLAGLVDLGPLNAVLTAAGRPAADPAGLDK
jgi:NitT/TauT family transport system substrate-binding protein